MERLLWRQGQALFVLASIINGGIEGLFQIFRACLYYVLNFQKQTYGLLCVTLTVVKKTQIEFEWAFLPFFGIHQR